MFSTGALCAFHSPVFWSVACFIRAEIVHWMLIYYCKSHLLRKWHLASSRFNDIIHKGMFFSHSHFLLCPLEHSNTDHHWFQPPDFIWTFDTGLYRSFLSRWSICASFVVFRTEPPTFPSSSFKLRAIERHWLVAVCVQNACNGVSTWQLFFLLLMHSNNFLYIDREWLLNGG